jgi:hypothetical protein
MAVPTNVNDIAMTIRVMSAYIFSFIVRLYQVQIYEGFH